MKAPVRPAKSKRRPSTGGAATPKRPDFTASTQVQALVFAWADAKTQHTNAKIQLRLARARANELDAQLLATAGKWSR